MITEIAQIDVKPGSEKDFEAAVAKARAAFGRSKGFHGFELHRSIEKPQRYRLMVKWETLENHTVDFRGSENFAEWRGLVGQYFASPPDVEHTNTVIRKPSIAETGGMKARRPAWIPRMNELGMPMTSRPIQVTRNTAAIVMICAISQRSSV